MKMNVFLTGNVQAGKSTAIKRFLEKENISPLGFTTHLDRSTGLLTIKIIGKDGDREIKAAAPIGGSRPVPDIEAFDRAGKMLKETRMFLQMQCLQCSIGAYALSECSETSRTVRSGTCCTSAMIRSYLQ